VLETYYSIYDLIAKRKQTKLTLNPVNIIEIPPKELVTYAKETQTPATDLNPSQASESRNNFKTVDDSFDSFQPFFFIFFQAKPLDYYGKFTLLTNLK
jgi:hypothetical protein